jgi:hypothetical protein
MKSKQRDFRLIFFIHLFLIVLFWLLPFLVNWKLVLLSVFLYYVNHYLWKATYGLCPLTMIEFKTKNPKASVWVYYLNKYTSLKVDKKRLHFVLFRIVPPTILVVSLVWQILLGFKPLIF